MDALEHLLDDLVEWHDIPEVPWSGVYRGRDEVMAYLREFAPAGVLELRFEVLELRPLGDEVLAVAKVEATGSGSGIDVAGPEFSYLWRVRDGKVVRVRVFLGRERALEAAAQRG